MYDTLSIFTIVLSITFHHCTKRFFGTLRGRWGEERDEWGYPQVDDVFYTP